MDGHSPSRRLHGFSTNRPPPLPAFPESPQARRSRDGSGSESESSSDASGGGPPPRGHQAHPDYATRRPQFASQTQGFRDRRRPSHLHATIYVDDPPYVPREAPPRPPSLRYAPIGGHEQVQHAPVDYRGRALPLPSHTSSTQYSGRRSSSGSPSGSERSQRSQESDDSGNGSERSESSDESSRERPRAVQQVSMAGVFHMHEPLNAPLPFNPERYPAYDAQARRIGLEHVRYESAPHDPSGQTYYRPRTHTYPRAREPQSPPYVPRAQDPPVRLPDPPAPQFERGPPSPPAIDYGMRQPSPPPAIDYEMRQLSPPPDVGAPPSYASPVRHVHPPQAVVPQPIRHSPPPMAPFSPANTASSTTDTDPFGSPVPEDEVTLDMLADPTYPGQKPNYPYPTLVKAAILSSPKRRLTLQEIYQALQDRFQWFRDNAKDKAWQNSIRHNLSLNKLFRKVARDITEPGKGSYWTVDIGAGLGNKRERKRNKRPNKAERERLATMQGGSASNQMDDQSSSDEENATLNTTMTLNTAATPTLSQTLGQTAAFSVSVAPLEEINIDPELRNGGHVVGQGRSRTEPGAAARNNARRGQSPYTRSPGAAPSVQAQPTFGQPSFGQPTFGQASFNTFQGTMGIPSQPSARPTQPGNPVSTAPTFRVTMPTTGRSSGRPSNSSRGRATPSMSNVTTQAAPVPIAPILQPTLHPSLNLARDTVNVAPGQLTGVGGAPGSGLGIGAGPAPPAPAYRQGSTPSDSSQD